MALIIGPNLNYIWLLSRSETPDAKLCDEYFKKASQLEINEDKWIKIRDCE